MELQLILSVVSLARWFLRYLDRLLFGSPVTLLRFESLLPYPIQALSANPIFLNSHRRVFGVLAAFVLWMLFFFALALIACIGIVAVIEEMGGGVQIDIAIVVCLVLSGIGAGIVAVRMLRGIKVELDGVGVLFYQGRRAVRVPWAVWLASGIPRRKSWSSSLVVVSIDDPDLIVLLETNKSGIEVTGSPCSVEILDSAFHLVLRDGCEVPALDLILAFQAIAQMSGAKTE